MTTIKNETHFYYDLSNLDLKRMEHVTVKDPPQRVVHHGSAHVHSYVQFIAVIICHKYKSLLIKFAQYSFVAVYPRNCTIQLKTN